MKTINGLDIDIRDVLLSVTNFCLGSCVYCELHKLKVFDFNEEWQLPHARRMLSDPMLDGMKNIHLTGGEALLSPKLYGTCQLVRELHPDIRANMSISGFFPEVTFKYMKKIHPVLPQLRLDISVDGPRDIHEKNRGKGSYDAVMRTIDYLRTIKDLYIQLQFTVMDSNYKYLRWVWDLAQSMDIDCYVCFPRNGPRFGHESDTSHVHSQEVIDSLDEQLRDTWCTMRPLNRQTWETQKAVWEGKRVLSDCYMWKHSIDISPMGDVYPCMCYKPETSYGNIKVMGLTDMFNTPQAHERMLKMQRKSCQPCPMPVAMHKTNYTIDGKPVEFGTTASG